MSFLFVALFPSDANKPICGNSIDVCKFSKACSGSEVRLLATNIKSCEHNDLRFKIKWPDNIPRLSDLSIGYGRGFISDSDGYFLVVDNSLFTSNISSILVTLQNDSFLYEFMEIVNQQLYIHDYSLPVV